VFRKSSKRLFSQDAQPSKCPVIGWIQILLTSFALVIGILAAATFSTVTYAVEKELGKALVDPMKPQWPGGRDPRIPALNSSGTSVSGVSADSKQGQVKLAAKSVQFSLAAISIIGGAKRAKINGQVVKEQEMIDGAKVVNIEPDKVTISVKGKVKTLVLNRKRAEILEVK